MCENHHNQHRWYRLVFCDEGGFLFQGVSAKLRTLLFFVGIEKSEKAERHGRVTKPLASVDGPVMSRRGHAELPRSQSCGMAPRAGSSELTATCPKWTSKDEICAIIARIKDWALVDGQQSRRNWRLRQASGAGCDSKQEDNVQDEIARMNGLLVQVVSSHPIGCSHVSNVFD